MALGNYVVIPFSWREDSGFKAFADVHFKTKKEAVARAHVRFPTECGAIAYKKGQSPETGIWEARVFIRCGDIPNDLGPYF